MKKVFASGIAALAILFLSSGLVFGQDTLIKKNKEEIKCKVTEVGVNEIKYKMPDNPDGPVFVIRKDEVWKIKYANGTETLITADKYSVATEQAILDKTNAIKFEVFSPLTGNITFCYERMLKVGTNIETKIGIIGPGLGDAKNRASGAFIKAGVKFLSGQDFVIDGMRYAHPLKGRYVRLELMFSSFTRANQYYYYNQYGSSGYYDVTTHAFAFDICFGKQWILGNALTLDSYIGFGYGGESSKLKNGPAGISNEDISYDAYYYSHLAFGEHFPMVITAGITMGVIF